ncbi:erythromycin esterase family protein [Streptomyces sp. NPDC059875]|uniref:erythromycin esterase family protein n=1 Tax=unclassified Streptomyces TaxID=2593676 RepID=UPI00365B68AB
MHLIIDLPHDAAPIVAPLEAHRRVPASPARRRLRQHRPDLNEGTINALPDYTAQQPKTYAVTPAPEGHNENTLDKVRYRDFSIDLRTAPAAALTSLDTARPTRSYGLYWSTDDPGTALSRSYDILIHLHRVEASRRR